MNNRTGIEGQPQIIRKRNAAILLASIRQCGDEKSHFEQLHRILGDLVCGPPSSLFIDEAPGQDVHVVCCYPIEHAVALEGLECRTLDAGEVFSIVHYGPHTTLGESWETLFDYVERHNIPVKGPRREIYLRYTGDDAQEYITELQVPLAIPVSELPM